MMTGIEFFEIMNLFAYVVVMFALLMFLIYPLADDAVEWTKGEFFKYYLTLLPLFALGITPFICFLNEEYGEQVETESVYLYAINDDTTMGGGYFLFCGSFNEDSVYWYYYKSGDGYKRDSISSDGLLIVMDDDEEPRIAYLESEKSFLFFSHVIRDVVIYIPEGSLIDDYELDNE